MRKYDDVKQLTKLGMACEILGCESKVILICLLQVFWSLSEISQELLYSFTEKSWTNQIFRCYTEKVIYMYIMLYIFDPSFISNENWYLGDLKRDILNMKRAGPTHFNLQNYFSMQILASLCTHTVWPA